MQPVLSEALEPSETTPTIEIKDVFELSKEEEQQLREQIKAMKGTVQLWIHTHYDEDRLFQNESIVDYLDYKSNRSRMVDVGLRDGSLPVISFIESHPLLDPDKQELAKYEKIYSDELESSVISPISPIYCVRTFQDTSTPAVLDLEDYAVLQEDTDIENWNALGMRFVDLGVSTIIIRGRNLYMRDVQENNLSTAEQLYLDRIGRSNPYDETSAIKIPAGCVGKCIVELSARGFTVKTSRITYPENMSNHAEI
jgi:hypothetical protein